MRNTIYCCLLFATMFTTSLSAVLKDEDMGSIGLVAKNYTRGGPVPDILQLQLRGGHRCRESVPDYMCTCWENLENQPAVQGRPSVILNSFIKPLLPHYDVYVDKDGEVIFPFPAPVLLQNELAKLGVSKFFQFYKDDSLVKTKEYLHLVADGKVPLAGLGNEESAAKMWCHNYLHDGFNHVAYKANEPHELATITQNHATEILKIQQEIEQELAFNNPLLTVLLHLTLATFAHEYDTAIGSLNNLLFDDFEKIEGHKPFSPELIKNICKKAENYLNFGLTHTVLGETCDNRFHVYSEVKIFLWHLFKAIIDLNRKNFIKEDTTVKRLMSNDQEFSDISLISPLEFDKISEELKQIVWQTLKIKGSQDDPAVSNWFSFNFLIKNVRINFAALRKKAMEAEITVQ